MAQADFFEGGLSHIVTADFLAEVFGVGRSMVYKYQDQGMPRRARGEYDLRACVQWMIAHVSKRSGGDDPEDLTAARLELVRAQTDGQVLENRRRAGELLPVDQVSRVLNEMAVIVSGQLDGLGPRCAGTLAGVHEPADIQGILFDECRDIRASIASAVQEFAGGYSSGNLDLAQDVPAKKSTKPRARGKTRVKKKASAEE